ncbi:MAG: hypothetical protein JO353_00250 [Phycisphaerae bacterium]|nr:hypothetical protein [Phycisphaerae bacterium]
MSVQGYLKELIESEMSIGDMARRLSIDEVFTLAQKQFKKSGMSDAELDRLVDAARAGPRNGPRKVTKPKKH